MRLQLLALTVAALVVATPAFAGDGKDNSHGPDGKGGHGKGSGRRVFCPHCGDACYPTVTKGKETKHCWNIETKTICIPKVRFPWETRCCGKDGCVPPKCGRTKEVRVLIKHEYECTVCKYSWDPASFKNGKGDEKYLDKAAPAEAAAPSPPPAPAEARRLSREPAAVPVTFESPAPRRVSAPVPREKSYAEILSGFFK